MDSKDSNENTDLKNEAESANDESKPEKKSEPELGVELTKNHQILSEIKKRLSQCSQILSRGEKITYCSVGGLDSGLPLSANEQGELPQNDSVPNDLITQKFGQEFFPESIIPGFYTWFQGDGSVVRYVMDFVLYTYRGDRFVPLEHLGRYETKIVMYCKIKHIGLVHTAEDLLETNHPWAKSFKNKKKVEFSEGLLKVPRKQRFFSSKVVLVDWYFDVGTSEEAVPHIWVVSDNDVHYKLDRPTGGYYNSFSPAKLLFDISTRVVKEMQSGRDKSFNQVLVSMTSPTDYYKNPIVTGYITDLPNEKGQMAQEQLENVRPHKIRIEDTEELTVWGAPVNIHGSSMVDVYRNLDFIFSECRYYYTFFGSPKMDIYLTELVQLLREQSPFHYFDSNFMKMEYMGKNSLANMYKDRLFVQKLDYPNTGSIINPLKLARLAKRGQKNKKFNLEEYNNQYSMNDVKSRSGRVIRNKAVSEIEPAVRKHVVQTESQKKEEYKKAVELEAKCDGLLLPFDFEWSNYNTCSEVSDDSVTPVICNDVEVALDNAKYYPRDIPLRTLKFYGNDELVDLLDLTRQFSVPSLSSSPLLPKMSFVQLEANLIFNSSLYEYNPTELSSFEITTPQCLCNNKRFNSIYDDINRSAHYNFYMYNNQVNGALSEASALSAREKLKDLMPDDEEFEDGMQWIYYLNKNIIDESDVEYPEDLDEGSIGRLYVGLTQELRRSVQNSGFDWFVQNLRESGELSDKKKEVQERELGIAISDADIALDFIYTNGGCLYRGRFKRVGPEPESTLPYVNTTRWNKRFKKFQRVVTVSSNYRYTTVSHRHDPDGFTVFDSNRPKNCPLDLVYGSDGWFKTSKEDGNNLPTFRKRLNVWKRESSQFKKANNDLMDSVNRYLKYFNRFVQSYIGAKLKPNKKLEAHNVDHEYYADYLVDGIDDVFYEPIFGFGYREVDTICQTEYILAEEMLTDYTWHTLLKLCLFYALYSSKASFKFKLNSVVWGDPSFYNSYTQAFTQDGQKSDQQKSEYNYDEEMLDTEKLKLLDEMTYDDYDHSNSGVEEDQSKEDEEEEEEEVEEGDEPDEGGEDKDRVGRRGWGINRYCPYYDFELEWHPDTENLERLSKGRISPEFIKEAFVKLRKMNFFQLELHERLSLLLWLGDILGYSASGKSFVDDRTDEFYYLRTQLLRSEDDRKGAKRQKGTSKELIELEERYLQKPVLLGHDRFYNPYYYFGLDYERRIYVQTMPQLRFVQNRIASRSRFLRIPKYKPEMFNLDLSEFAQKFAQDRIFIQTKGKRGRKKEIQDDSMPTESTTKRKKRAQNAPSNPLNGTDESLLASKNNELNSQPTKLMNETKSGFPVSNERGAALNNINSQLVPVNLGGPTVVKNEVETNLNSVMHQNHQVSGVKREDPSKYVGYKENLDGYLNSSNPNDAAAKEDDLVKRRRIKNRSRNRPKVRRSRQVFDRHPTNFSSVKEYLDYLSNGPARLSWCVIDSHKSLKRFITRLSQFTTNERNLALKLTQVEPDFTLPTFEILTYKCPTIIGEMLLTLLRGLYRYYKNVFTKMVLSSVVFNGVKIKKVPINHETLNLHYPDLAKSDSTKFNQASVTVNAHLSGASAHQIFSRTLCGSVTGSPLFSPAKTRPHSTNNLSPLNSGVNSPNPGAMFGLKLDGVSPTNNSENNSNNSMNSSASGPHALPFKIDLTSSTSTRLISDKLSKSYNSGLFLNLYVSDLLKTCLSLCVSDLEGNKKCLKIMLELMYFFEFVANRYYNDTKWSHMRNEWRMNLDSIYSLLQVNINELRSSRQKNQIRSMGDHNANCYVYNNSSSSSNVITAMISTPYGETDLISLVERAGLWFRFFEVYSRDKNFNFDINTSVNYTKFMEKYNLQLSIRNKTINSSNLNGKLSDMKELTTSQKFEIDLLGLNAIDLIDFFNRSKLSDSLVFFSGGLLELIASVKQMLNNLNELLGIKVQVETSKPKGSKSKSKKRKKKKDKDEESDSALTDVESNIDINDMYQEVQAEVNEASGVEATDDLTPPITPLNEQKDDQSPVKTQSQEKDDQQVKNEDITGVNVKREEGTQSDHQANGNGADYSSPLVHDSQNENGVQDTQASQLEESKSQLNEKRETDDRPEKAKKAKKSKPSKNSVNEKSSPQEEDESSNEMEVQKESDHLRDSNNEELLDPIKKLLSRLEAIYQNAPKETCQIKLLTMTSCLLKVQLPPKNSDSTPENQTDDEESRSSDQTSDGEEPSIEILCLNLTVSSVGSDVDSDGEDEDLDENLGLIANLRRVCRTMSRIEKTRATKKAIEEPGYTPRESGASPPRVFTLTVPVLLKSPETTQFPQYIYAYDRVFNSLTYLWRTPLKCKNAKTNQTGVIKKANYTSLDIWKCVSVEWNDNKKEQVAHNPWELSL